MKKQIVKCLHYAAVKHGRLQGLWKKFGDPSLEDWTEYLRKYGNLRNIGDNCAINPSVVFADPYMTHIGSNVRIAGGILLGHDGSVNMINRARNTKYDAVGPIMIADNVFIGVGCIVLPGAMIEANTIIGAGSVVSGRVQGGGVYAGNPLRLIRSFDEHLKVLEMRTASYPWQAIIEARKGGYDAKTEPDLKLARIAHFFQ